MPLLSMEKLNLTNKRVLMREDLNVPVKQGHITSTLRIDAALPSIELALSKGATVILMSHLGRPEEGKFDPNLSLAPVADYLAKKLDRPVKLIKDPWQKLDLAPNSLALLENVRFNSGEKANASELGKAYASLADVFVMDAFGTAHRAQASTERVAHFAQEVAAGPLLMAEVEALNLALANPAKPMLAIVGGAKVSSKLNVLKSLSGLCDQIIVGGGIANTFLAAKGYNIGKSLYEPDLLDTARAIMQEVTIPLPVDVAVATEFSSEAKAIYKPVDQVADNEQILDVGPETQKIFDRLIGQASTILWNGPVGVFEFAQFSAGSEALAKAVANSKAFSLAGGGDTLAAIEKYQLSKKISYISTGGGAFLEFVEGKELPAIAVLKNNKNDS